MHIYKEDLEQFKYAIEFYKNVERYKLDYIFKIVIDTLELAYYVDMGEYGKYAHIDQLFENINKIENKNDLVANFFILANAYAAINKIVKATYCYMSVIEIEANESGFFTTIANHNIGKLYYMYNNYDKALSYYKKARLTLPQKPINDKDIDYLWLCNTAELANVYYKLGQIDKFLYYYKLCQENKSKQLVDTVTIICDKEMMHYNYIQNDFTELQRIYNTIAHKLKKAKRYPELLEYSLIYYDLAQKLNVNLSAIINTMKAVEKETKNKGHYNDEIKLLNLIINYHIEEHQINESTIYIKRLIEKLSNYEELNKAETQKIMELHFDKQNHHQYTVQEMALKEQLESENQYLLKRNKKMGMLYSRLQLIQNIGRDITISSNSVEIAKKIYHNMIKLFRIDNLCLLSLNKKEKCLEYQYVHNSIINISPITLGAYTSALNDFLQNAQIVSVIDADKDKKHQDLLAELNIDTNIYKSALIAPLIIENKSIAIIYIVSQESNSYNSISYESAEQVAIYCAIAINNINRKQELIKVIKEQQEAKEQFIKLNKELKSSSHLLNN